jgi:general secretion pathway protein K
VEVSFQDESGKIPLAHADMTTLTNMFEAWQVAPADAEKLADAIEGWMVKGYSYTTTLTPDYPEASVPYAEPQRPMRAFTELAAIDDAREFFFDENGLPNGNYWRFVDDFSLFNYPQPNANGANADVMAALGQYTDIQRQHINDFLNGTGQYATDGAQWLQNAAQLSAVAGLGGSAGTFGTTIAALRINVTVPPQGGATTNQTLATNATAAAATASPSTATSITNTAQPSSTANSATAAAAASQSINYPFTLLEILEDDEIPQPPPAPTQT